LSEVLPVAAWISSGSAPSLADTSSNNPISNPAATDKKLFHRGFYFTRFGSFIQAL